MIQSFFKSLIVISVTATITSCGGHSSTAPTAPPPTPVNVRVVAKGAAVYFDTYPATIVALNQVDLKAQVTGYITGIYFSDGQHVTKGQKLYDIDRLQYQATYDNAVGNLNVVKSNLDKAQQDANRYNDLLKQDAIAKQVVDHALADLQSAKMQVSAASATVSRAAADLKYATIYAPFDGTIGISQVKSGALVTANQTLLNTVSTDNPMAVDIAIDQKEIPRFVALQHAATAKDSTLTIQFSDNTVYSEPGTISFIDRAVDPTTGTIKVRLSFPNKDGLLRSGMNCNIAVKNNNAQESFVLAPYKAVVEQLGEYFVFVVDHNKALQRKVTLGARINDNIVVKAGLQEGDSLVIEGVQKLRDSSAVQIGAPKK
ncbi:efflux RND transporter periplasmic adaptor subunit [Ferruginibacter albus]|uniref:efflux RND transporter periplasmic adaptor subunit n=1 Tax=Ferruginibacter albus TaxID=2875540 RepID=UPI001CC7E5C0|nr:efflux RND transporter periplasmic adaptor subunit [Ferruginibacter albus]UAY50631.1 efflux RND transporter periplasmic adaptor subunit [Ferruginibacter albus]